MLKDSNVPRLKYPCQLNLNHNFDTYLYRLVKFFYSCRDLFQHQRKERTAPLIHLGYLPLVLHRIKSIFIGMRRHFKERNFEVDVTMCNNALLCVSIHCFALLCITTGYYVLLWVNSYHALLRVNMRYYALLCVT